MVTADTFVCHVQQNISAWFGSLTAQNDYLEFTHLSVQQSEKDRAKTDFSIEFRWNVFVPPFRDERENESILHFDWIFMLMQLYVPWWMCYRMAIFPFLLHHIHTDDWNIYRWIWSTWYRQLATFNLSTSQMAMIDWFPNESTLRKILTQKSQRKKKDIEFRLFESHAKININPHSHVVYF